MSQSKSLIYQPAEFTDKQRSEKIHQLLPTIKDYFQYAYESNRFPGLTYGLIVNGELIDSNSFGCTDLERKLPVTCQSLFRIASMTKSFTAMAIVKLRDEGKLRLDDPVSKYIPELNQTNFLTHDSPIITIRDLLIQNAGMPEDDPWADRQLSINDNEFLAMLNKGISLSNPPGTIWEYTNLGYTMLGRIITVVSQQSFQDYITQEILIPLDMKNTFWEYDDIQPDLIAHGYRWESERYIEEELLHDGTYAAMGGLISSIEDFSKYISYHLQAWPARTQSEFGPIRRSSLREMHHPWNFISLHPQADNSTTIITSAYCYGLIWSKTTDGIVSINHTGGLPGFGSNWMILPEYGIGLVSFSNSTYADLCHINEIILERIVKLGDLKTRQLSNSYFLSQRKEQLIDVLIKNNWNLSTNEFEQIFTENFFLDQNLELRRKTSENFFNQIGTIVTIRELIPKNQLRGNFLIDGERATLHIAFSLSPENPPLIQELKFTVQS